MGPSNTRFDVQQNIRQYLTSDWGIATEMRLKKPPHPVPQSSPMSLPPSSPPTFTPSPTHQGLIIPPFPYRERRKDGPIRILKNNMDEKEANGFKAQIFEQLEDFDRYAVSYHCFMHLIKA